MYSTSPSSSSMASSSGRSSPEQSSSKQQQQRSNSFLLPQFFFSQSNNGSNSATNQDNNPHPVQNALYSQAPRRTSFGAGFSNSGRFSALSAFGFTSASAGLSSSPPASFAGASELSRRTGSAIESPQSESLSSSPTQSSTQKSSSFSTNTSMAPPAPPAKRHLCFPDGMGGTVCVEVKDPKRRGSSVN
ncbi:hypothetical protein PSEUBRA_000221 [Kalmanozyma brasiliensis GHG001]|uniref:uncharacterized protein n=1 Tax=Kalmanozyma brasiliensis (strain GHG001) TaxID=1365824 RepID=UPI0028683A36|nr:uncharacterized protein PSEUBRA_000221 [Kalmanozyma brasiliensis GHG001]KAF6766788.1 hypothetical protein PSEUBRA_000221 [Kalmanozyma brasiliensis GHG001]